MSKLTIDEILAPKPVARPRICAYAIDDAPSASANGATQAQPRATPWVAGAQHPFYAIDDAPSTSANGATQAQPRATPWVAGAQHPFSPEGAT